jgi:hypothetical protein
MWLDVNYFIDDNEQIDTGLVWFDFEYELMCNFIRKLFIIIVLNQLWYYYIQTIIINILYKLLNMQDKWLTIIQVLVYKFLKKYKECFH